MAHAVGSLFFFLRANAHGRPWAWRRLTGCGRVRARRHRQRRENCPCGHGLQPKRGIIGSSPSRAPPIIPRLARSMGFRAFAQPRASKQKTETRPYPPSQAPRHRRPAAMPMGAEIRGLARRGGQSRSMRTHDGRHRLRAKPLRACRRVGAGARRDARARARRPTCSTGSDIDGRPRYPGHGGDCEHETPACHRPPTCRWRVGLFFSSKSAS